MTPAPALPRSARLARLGRRLHALWVFVLYFALTALLTYPLARVLGTAVPSDPGDPLLNTWILWWNAQAWPFLSRWWNAPAFYPVPGALTFSEHLAGVSVISTPIQWLGGGPQLAYNVAFLLSFPLSAISAYLLTFELTRRVDASLIAGAAYGFAPYRMAHLSHLQVLSAYWMPLALLGLHAYVRTGRRRWLVLFGASWILNGLCNGYYLLYFSVLVALWVLWFLPARGWRTLVPILGTWIVSGLLIVPVLLKYRSIHEQLGLVRGIGEIRDFSADLASFLDAAGHLAVWGFLSVYHRAEGELFPGVMVVLVTILGLLSVPRHAARPPQSLRRTRILLTVAAALFASAVVSVFVIGPWRVRLLMIPLSVTRVQKPMSLVVACLLGLAVTSPRIRTAYTRGSLFGFYLFAALCMWIFALGPSPTAFGFPLLYRAPYAVLMLLPGFDSLRVPARFAMPATLCLSVTAGLAYCHLESRFTRWRSPLLIVIATGILADGWMLGMSVAAAPPVWQVEECVSPRDAMLELPLGNFDVDVGAMYRSMRHGYPVVNGYSGFFPPSYAALQNGLALHDTETLGALTALGVGQVLVNDSADPDHEWTRFVGGYEGATQVCSRDGKTLYRLATTRPRPPARPLGPKLGFANAWANVNGHDVKALTDGDLQSRWQTGPQRGTHQLVIDLGAVKPIGAVVMSLGPYVEDFPRELIIDSSQDGLQWSEGWRGLTASHVFTAALEHPTEIPIVFELAETSARFVRFRQLRDEPVMYWSIAELAVLAPSSE